VLAGRGQSIAAGNGTLLWHIGIRSLNRQRLDEDLITALPVLESHTEVIGIRPAQEPRQRCLGRLAIAIPVRFQEIIGS